MDRREAVCLRSACSQFSLLSQPLRYSRIVAAKKTAEVKVKFPLGSISSYLFLVGFVGLGSLIVGIIAAIKTGKLSVGSDYLLIGLVGLAIGAAAFFFAWRKLPTEKKILPKVMYAMVVIGLGASWKLAWSVFWPIIKWLLSVTLHIDLGGSGGGGKQSGGGWTRFVCDNVNIPGYFYLSSEDEFGGYLRDDKGNTFYVRKWRNANGDWVGGTVEDDAGNHYRAV